MTTLPRAWPSSTYRIENFAFGLDLILDGLERALAAR
jgi:hypothetical protein